MKCPNCEKEINEKSKFCQYCGALVPLTTMDEDILVFKIVGLLIIIILSLFFILN